MLADDGRGTSGASGLSASDAGVAENFGRVVDDTVIRGR